MDPSRAYRQVAGVEWTRIDMLLALFNRAIERLESAITALKADDRPAALPHLCRASVLVCELAAGLDPKWELAPKLLRLYEFVTWAVAQETLDKVDGALTVLRNLREAYEKIRPQALSLERFGSIPPLKDPHLLRAMA